MNTRSTPVPRADFAAHRARLLARLDEDEAVLLFGSPERTRSNDTEYRYRPDSDVWWLTGWRQPEVAVFLRPGDTPLTMFVQARDPEAETWTGRRPGPEGAEARHGADAAFPMSDLAGELPRLLQGVRRLHHAFGRNAAHDRLLMRSIRKAAKAARKNGLDVPTTFHSPDHLVHELRLVKSEDELALLREAARRTCAVHTELMRTGRAGVGEDELERRLEAAFRGRGGTGPGYTPICAAGDNATILHYIDNDDVLEPGELVLVDAGGEVGFYTADVTRTWPVDGRFTPIQRQAYEIVLAAQHAAIDTCRPGRTFAEVHDAAVRVLTQGMVDLGLLEGDVDALIEDESFKRYYMHGTSHWLGLDVHDVGLYAREGRSRELGPGMVLTVEPGLYVPVDDEDAPEALRGLGIRIEDDIHVTEGDPEVLTAACPTDVDAIEEICQG